MSDNAWILLADDEEDYILLIQRAFSSAGIENPIYAVRSGDEVIAYLSGDGRYFNRAEYPLPDLLLLDLKMPGTDGFEVLRWIRKQPGLESLRVLVLTSSEQIREVNQAYKLGANSFLVKPMDFEDLIQLSRSIRDFWLKLSKGPETSRPPRNGDNNARQGSSEKKRT